MKNNQKRNAYAVPAKQRGNAGAMVHKGTKRKKIRIEGECEICKMPIIDDEPTCDCEENE